MNPQGGFTGSLSPDAVQTAIDAALYEQYNRTEQPGYVRSSDSFFFKQSTTEGRRAFIWDEDSGIPDFQETEEQEEILNVDTHVGNQKTKNSQKYTSQVPVSDEAFKADQISKREAIGRGQADAAARTQDRAALLTTYGDAFAGSLNTTPDGQALASNSHVTLRGATVDNLETGALNADNLWTNTVSLANQRGQHGGLGSHVFSGIVVPFLLFKTARETLNSELVPQSGENAVNVFDTDYGFVRIGASAFLGSTYNSAANANTSYSLVSDNHMIMRKVFYDIDTKLIPPEATANDSWLYRVKFNETTFPGSWTGYVGSNGTA